MKLKEWNFEKNLKKSQMDVPVAKAAKRSRDEDKDILSSIMGRPRSVVKKFKTLRKGDWPKL